MYGFRLNVLGLDLVFRVWDSRWINAILVFESEKNIFGNEQNEMGRRHRPLGFTILQKKQERKTNNKQIDIYTDQIAG